MRIEAIDLRNFLPFADGIVEFPRVSSNDDIGEVHLLTGQNGTGKTRMLCLLAAACGNTEPLDARISSSEEIKASVIARVGNELGCWSCHRRFVAPIDSKTVSGCITVAETFTDAVPSNFPSYLPLMQNAMTDVYAFRGLARVADAKIVALSPLKPGSPADHLTFEPSPDEDAMICQSMSNLKMTAAMDAMRKIPVANSRGIRMVQNLEAAITRITDRDFTFDVVPHPDIRLRVFWGGVTMSISQLPDGLRSIIGWLVSCVAKLDAHHPDCADPLGLPLILLLDEPETHLHPAWQRKILPAAQSLFPQAQIFVATHSPFVISSVNQGWIHVFRADQIGQVSVEKARPCGKGDTYIDIIEDILGVTEWYDPETEGMLAAFRETRDSVLAGAGDYASVASQAEALANRSESLRDIMGREMRQLDRQLAQRKTSA